MNKCFYAAEVEWDPNENGHVITSYSLHCAENYTSAMNQVVEDFGEDAILSVKLILCSDGLGHGILISESLAHALHYMNTEDIQVKEEE